MVLKDHFILAIAVISLIVSLFAIRVSKKQATSDFQAEQEVKKDTAMLLATLRSLAYKGVVYSQQPKNKRDDPKFPEFVDISEEKSKIQKFLTSTTAVAYYGYASRKSKQASEEEHPEEWRTFFLRIVLLLQEDNPYDAAEKAVFIEKTFFNFSAKEFEAILTELSNLPQAIESGNEIRENDVVLKALKEIAEGREER